MSVDEKAELSLDEETEIKEVLDKLNRVADEVKHRLRMDDWSFKICYSPDEDSEDVADVSYSLHKEGTITFYQYRPEYVTIDMAHEMYHAKIGRIGRQYRRIVKKQHQLILKMAAEAEEETIDALIDMHFRKP